MTPEQVRAIARDVGATPEVADYLEKIMRRIFAEKMARIGLRIIKAAKETSP